MATTNARIQSPSAIASTRLYMATLFGSGTPNGAGYLNAGEYGGWYVYNNITEPLVGAFFYQIVNSTNQVLANGIIDLRDDTSTYFGFDPPNSLFGTFQFLERLDGFLSSRMASYTQPTGFLAAAFPATVASTTNITSVGSVTGAVGSVTGLTASNLDATISSRATPANVTTQLTAQGLTSARAGFLDNLDATISSRLSETNSAARQVTNIAEHDATQATLAGLNNLSIANVQTAMTNQGYTSGRGPLLDNLNATITSRLAESDSATRQTALLAQHTATQGTLTTILSNIAAVPAAVWNYLSSAATTVGSLGKRIVDNLDAAITSREAESAASTRATTNQTEHDATQASLASVSVTLDAGDLVDIGNAVWNATTAAAVTAGTFGVMNKTNLDATISSRLSETDSASRQATNIAEHDATQTTLAGLQNLSIANVQTAMTNQGYTGVRGAYLDRLDVDVSTRQSESDALARYNDINTDVGAVATSVAGLGVQAATTAALIALGYTSTRANKIDNLDNLTTAAPTAAVIVDAVLDEALSGHMTAGTAGEAIKLARDQALIAATNTQP